MDNFLAIPENNDPILTELFNELTNIPDDFEVIWETQEPSTASTTSSANGKQPADENTNLLNRPSGDTYTFPTSLNQYPGISDNELNDRLEKLCNTRNLEGLVSYNQIRTEACSISLELNRRGLLPPRFRSMRKAKPAPKSKDSSATSSTELAVAPDYADKILSNDRKMIDLHFLHCLGKREKIEDSEFRHLFCQEEFDFDLACRLVSKNWRTGKLVAKILCLTDVEQWQMASLMSEQVRTRWTEVTDRAFVLKRKLKNLAHRQQRIAPLIDDFVLLWIADQICDAGPHQLIGQVHGWQKGAHPLAKSTLSTKLVTMRRWTKAV